MEAERKEALFEAIESLPPEKQEEVREYVRRLGEEDGERRHLRQDWAGEFSKLGDEYTSVELQHQAVEQWKEMVRNS